MVAITTTFRTTGYMMLLRFIVTLAHPKAVALFKVREHAAMPY